MRREYSHEERLERACVRAAMHIRGAWEEKGSSDSRYLTGLFIPDELVLAGHSRAFTGKGRREHVVPRVMIVNRCHEMLKAGESDEAIARFIRDHVRIVMISHEECERLDRKAEHGLRQTMPENWAFGGDIYARLKTAGIEWDEAPATAG